MDKGSNWTTGPHGRPARLDSGADWTVVPPEQWGPPEGDSPRRDDLTSAGVRPEQDLSLAEYFRRHSLKLKNFVLCLFCAQNLSFFPEKCP